MFQPIMLMWSWDAPFVNSSRAISSCLFQTAHCRALVCLVPKVALTSAPHFSNSMTTAVLPQEIASFATARCQRSSDGLEVFATYCKWRPLPFIYVRQPSFSALQHFAHVYHVPTLTCRHERMTSWHKSGEGASAATECQSPRIHGEGPHHERYRQDVGTCHAKQRHSYSER